jgi:threonine dehydrogenase-like Zn-dependent dehydrogenase
MRKALTALSPTVIADLIRADEEALVMLSDMLPTGFECGVLNGKVAPGSTVAIVGSGPIGLAALLTAQLYSPAEIIVIDLDDNRLGVARKFGATQTVNSTDGKAADTVMAMTGKRGVDTAIEAVGIPATFELCGEIIAPGGTIANIGVHGTKVDLHLERLWSQNIAITTRLVDTVTTPARPRRGSPSDGWQCPSGKTRRLRAAVRDCVRKALGGRGCAGRVVYQSTDFARPIGRPHR